MNFQDCLEKGLIKESVLDKEIIDKELTIANKFLTKAKTFFHSNEPEAAGMFCYIAMFHYARALLYSKGFKERSHFCVFQYLINNCSGKLKTLGEACQNYRYIREALQYDGLDINKEVLNEMLIDAEELKIEVEKQLLM